MGTHFEFICEGYGYSAEVSGGKDRGMIAVVQTMICSDCTELVDVLIGRPGQDLPTDVPELDDPDLDLGYGYCPQCDGKNVAPWEESRRCPRCDARMKKGNTRAQWD